MGTLKKLLQNKIEYTGGCKQMPDPKWRLKAAALWTWHAQLVTQLFQMCQHSNVTMLLVEWRFGWGFLLLCFVFFEGRGGVGVFWFGFLGFFLQLFVGFFGFFSFTVSWCFLFWWFVRQEFCSTGSMQICNSPQMQSASSSVCTKPD